MINDYPLLRNQSRLYSWGQKRMIFRLVEDNKLMILFIILALKENQAWERFSLPRGFSLHATGKKKLHFLLIIPFISMYNPTTNTFTWPISEILQPFRFWNISKPISLLRLFSGTKIFYTKTLKRRAQVVIDTRKSHGQNVTLCLQNPTLWLIFLFKM